MPLAAETLWTAPQAPWPLMTVAFVAVAGLLLAVAYVTLDDGLGFRSHLALALIVGLIAAAAATSANTSTAADTYGVTVDSDLLSGEVAGLVSAPATINDVPL